MPEREAGILWWSKITEVHENGLHTRGVDQRKIIREFSFEEMVSFLLMGVCLHLLKAIYCAP